MSVTVTWKTLDDGKEHAETFRGFTGRELAERRAWELGLSSGTFHIRVERPDAPPVEVPRFSAEDCSGEGWSTDPPEPDADDWAPMPAAGWDALAYGFETGPSDVAGNL